MARRQRGRRILPRKSAPGTPSGIWRAPLKTGKLLGPGSLLYCMNDTASLLGQLKIDREPELANSRASWRWLILLVVPIAALLLWYLGRGPEAIPVTVVTVAQVGNGTQASVLDASGYVIARRRATVSSKITGKVTEVLIEEGQVVAADAILARIDDSNAQANLALARAQLEATQAQLGEVRVQLAEARRQLNRTRELTAKQLASEQALDAAQASHDALQARLNTTQMNVTVAQRAMAVQQRLLEDTVIRAPFAGVITEKNAQPGEMISPLSAGGAGTRTGIGTLVDMDSLEIEVDVNENFINRISPEQPVTVQLNAYPQWQIPARVIAVVPAADRSKATVRVRVGFAVNDARILPDMGVRVAFMDAARQDAGGSTVIVPAQAVSRDGDTDVVYLLSGEQVERRAVRIEGTLANGLKVSAGLRGGERLAVGDFSLLHDGAVVRLQAEN